MLELIKKLGLARYLERHSKIDGKRPKFSKEQKKRISSLYREFKFLNSSNSILIEYYHQRLMSITGPIELDVLVSSK